MRTMRAKDMKFNREGDAAACARCGASFVRGSQGSTDFHYCRRCSPEAAERWHAEQAAERQAAGPTEPAPLRPLPGMMAMVLTDEEIDLIKTLRAKTHFLIPARLVEDAHKAKQKIGPGGDHAYGLQQAGSRLAEYWKP